MIVVLATTLPTMTLDGRRVSVLAPLLNCIAAPEPVAVMVPELVTVLLAPVKLIAGAPEMRPVIVPELVIVVPAVAEIPSPPR